MWIVRRFAVLFALLSPIASQASAQATIRIVLVGDSTVAVGGGWGPGFCARVASHVTCEDVAANGRSSKSFREEGRWTRALALHGDVYLIQFGHNDQKPDPARHTDPETGFRTELRSYVADARAAGALPVLVTPLTRRTFIEGHLAEDGLAAYATATRAVAAEVHVPLVDLFALSQRALAGGTQSDADRFDADLHPDQKAENGSASALDRTHLNAAGQAFFGGMVADALAVSAPSLGSTIRAALVSPTFKTTRVGAGAGAQFCTVQAAVDALPATGGTLVIEPGVYREKITVRTRNVRMIGLGAEPGDTVLSWNDSAGSAGGTNRSASVSVLAAGFEAENVTVENTWENEHESRPQGAQAVALLVNADRAVFDHVRLVGAQDTLYANSATCHETAKAAAHTPCLASRQFYRDCFLEGHVDFIFGDAKAVFDHCELHPRFHAEVMLTAQSRLYPEEDSGFYFLHCAVTGADDGATLLLGRPWRDRATAVFFDTLFDRRVDAAGWADWDGRLATSTYREYDSHGSGVNGGHRIATSPLLAPAERAALAPLPLLGGADGWDAVAAADRLRADWRTLRHAGDR